MFHVRVTLPPPKVVDRWNEKRAMFGVYDNIGILGKTRPPATEFQNGSCGVTTFQLCRNGILLNSKSRHLHVNLGCVQCSECSTLINSLNPYNNFFTLTGKETEAQRSNVIFPKLVSGSARI